MRALALPPLLFGLLLTASTACDGADDRPARSMPFDAAADAARPAAFDAGTRRDASAGDAATLPPHTARDASDDGAMDAAPLEPARDAAEAGLDASPAPDAAQEPSCEPFVMPSDCADPGPGALPAELRCTGLYADAETRSLACGVLAYRPAFELWSDGADKHRYVALPPGATIDASDPDAFVFPVGTQFWKEFRVRTAGGAWRLGETRLLRKLDSGWAATTYIWSEDESRALQENDGVADLHGTGHIVPTRDQCTDCHGGRPDFVLGWDAFMLGPGASGVTLETLADMDALAPAADDAGAAPWPVVPGDAIERAGLGYLHANCGVSCHNPTRDARARDTQLFLRLDAQAASAVLNAPALVSGLNKPPSANAPVHLLEPPADGPFYGIRPGDPARSLVLARMQVRGTAAQMPRIATARVDDDGVAVITAFIEHMTEARGYPAAAE